MRTFLRILIILGTITTSLLAPFTLYSQDSNENLSGSSKESKGLKEELEQFYSEIKKKTDKIGKGGAPGKVSHEDLVKKALRVRDYFRGLDEKEVIPKLKESLKKTPFHTLFDRYPVLYTFLKEEFRHETALPELFKLTSKKRDFVLYGAFFFFTVLLGYYLKKKALEEEASGVAAWFRRSMLLFVMRIGGFLFFFGRELFPTFEVIINLF